MNKKKKNKIFLLLILLLGITVGFAALATTLKINGNAGIGKNSWNIYWDSIGNEDGVTPETATEIVDEDTTHKKNIVTFDVKFDKPGDFYEFQVDAVNAGTIDAEILEIESKYNDAVISQENPLPSYLKYSVKYADGTDITVGDKLAKRTSTTEFTRRRYKIRVEYDKDAVTIADVNNQVGEVTHSFSFKVVYGQSSGETVPAAVAFSTDSWETIKSVGDLDDPTTGPYRVGDTKTIEMDLDNDGVNETYTLRIANLSKPAVCNNEGFSQTACGLVLEFVDIISLHVMNPNNLWTNGSYGIGTIGGWEYSDMRAYLNNGKHTEINVEKTDYTNTGLLSKLPSDLRDNIATTKVVSGHGYNDANNYVTNDKRYLLSQHELMEHGENSVGTDGYSRIDFYDASFDTTRQLDYYDQQGVRFIAHSDTIINYEKLHKLYNNSAYPWWFRSANPSSSVEYMIQMPGERAFMQYTCVTQFGVSPAFRIG